MPGVDPARDQVSRWSPSPAGREAGATSIRPIMRRGAAMAARATPGLDVSGHADDDVAGATSPRCGATGATSSGMLAATWREAPGGAGRAPTRSRAGCTALDGRSPGSRAAAPGPATPSDLSTSKLRGCRCDPSSPRSATTKSAIQGMASGRMSCLGEVMEATTAAETGAFGGQSSTARMTVSPWRQAPAGGAASGAAGGTAGGVAVARCTAHSASMSLASCSRT